MGSIFRAIRYSKPLQLFLAVQVVLFFVLLAGEPAAKLSWRWVDLIWLAGWLPFFRFVPWKQVFWAGGAIQVLFLPGYYYTEGSANLVSMALLGLGLLVPGLRAFILWNLREIRAPHAWRDLLISVSVFAVFAFSYPPFPLGILIFVLLSPWFVLLSKRSVSRGLWLTYWGAVVYHIIGYYWLLNVIGVGPAPAIIFGLYLLVSFLSIFYVFLAWVYQKTRALKGGFWLFPLFWAGVEVLRTKGDFSFPWAHVGYTLGDSLEILQSLNWIGIFGYAVLIVFTNTWLASHWSDLLAFVSQRRPKLLLKALLPVLLIPVLLYVVGAIRLSQAPDHEELIGANSGLGASSLKIAMLQPSVLQKDKWSPEFYRTVMDNLWTMMDQVDTSRADIVVLPETAVPDFLYRRRRVEYRRFQTWAKENQTSVLVGALNYDTKARPPRKRRFFNSSFLFEPSGNVEEYRKIHLVPFSERIPWDDVFPLLNYVDFGEGDFSSGEQQHVYFKGKWNCSPNICYEAIYPYFFRESLDEGARILLNITNDGWFGESAAPYHHANLVRFRSVENGVPVARCANSGISVFYDAWGREFETTKLMERTIVYYEMPLMTERSLYSRIGGMVENFFFWFLLLGLPAYLFSRRKQFLS